MGAAFETTPEDVLAVARLNGRRLTDSEAEDLFDAHVLPHADEVEKAALYGLDLDEQTQYAHAEIARILIEAGELTQEA